MALALPRVAIVGLTGLSVIMSVCFQGTAAFAPGLVWATYPLRTPPPAIFRNRRSPALRVRASTASGTPGNSEETVYDEEFLSRWDEAKAAQMLPSSGLSGWRAHLLDNPTALLQVEDFLDDACNIVRAAGGSMLTTDFAEEYQRRHHGTTICTKGCTLIDWHMPNAGVKKTDGSDVTMGEVIAACTRLLVQETKEPGVKRICLRMNEEGQELKGPGGTQLIQISTEDVVKGGAGVSAIHGSLKSVLDYAVDEVLESHGYVESDRVILFDGVCNLCNTAVNFILDHDVEEKFKFAALQSETGHALMRKAKRDPNDMSTMVLAEGGRVFDKSDAVLRIGAELQLPGNLEIAAALARVTVPKVIRDWVYLDVISKNRVKWFGSSDQCRLMDEGLEKRFYT